MDIVSEERRGKRGMRRGNIFNHTEKNFFAVRLHQSEILRCAQDDRRDTNVCANGGISIYTFARFFAGANHIS